MKRITTLFIASAICLTASAQIHLTADLQNNHLWRGMEVADGCLILTDLGYTFANGHMTLGLWGGTNTQGSYKEFNHYITLRTGGLEFSAMDTYNFSPGATYNNRQYFNYSAQTKVVYFCSVLSAERSRPNIIVDQLSSNGNRGCWKR